MKVLFLTYGPRVVASSRSRVYQYLPFFRKDGIDYKVITYKTGLAHSLHRFRPKSSIGRIVKMLISKNIRGYNLFFAFIKALWFFTLSNFFDILFIQKVFLPDFIIKFLKRKEKKIVFDFDDAIYAISRGYNKRRFDHQLPLYDLLVVGNASLRKYTRGFTDNDILVITSPIDCKQYYPKTPDERNEVIVGWIGSPASQKYLNMLEHVSKRLCNVYKNLIFELVGAQNINFNEQPFRQKRWSLNTEVADLQNFDIGIMPLPDNEWTKGKGGYKLLQYMAVGIPCVASPIGINRELIREGENGFLVATEDEWYEKISLLIEDPGLRKRMGMRGRDFVVKNYSLEIAAPKLISALEQLI